MAEPLEITADPLWMAEPEATDPEVITEPEVANDPL